MLYFFFLVDPQHNVGHTVNMNNIINLDQLGKLDLNTLKRIGAAVGAELERRGAFRGIDMKAVEDAVARTAVKRGSDEKN